MNNKKKKRGKLHLNTVRRMTICLFVIPFIDKIPSYYIYEKVIVIT